MKQRSQRSCARVHCGLLDAKPQIFSPPCAPRASGACDIPSAPQRALAFSDIPSAPKRALAFSDIPSASKRALALSGRCDTGKRARCASTLARVGLASALSLVTAGCNFTDFSKTKPIPTPDAGLVPEPACLKSIALSDAGITPVALWTFDNKQNGGEWLDNQGAHALAPAADPAADAGATLADYPRINGDGQSL